MRFHHGQTQLNSYSKTLRVFWRQLYMRGGRTIYSRERFTDKKPDWVNVEHIFPMAWVINDMKCIDRRHCRYSSADFNHIEADLHNLYPARAKLNMLRGHYQFGYVRGHSKSILKHGLLIDKKNRVVQPHAASQGEIARAMFYMADAYQLRLFKKSQRILRKWHKIDPVSQEEMRRNNLIEQLQGVRNRFIDEPELVEQCRFADT